MGSAKGGIIGKNKRTCIRSLIAGSQIPIETGWWSWQQALAKQMNKVALEGSWYPIKHTRKIQSHTQ